MFRYCLAVLLGAGLLFLVQPMMGRLMVPSFGGLAIVWTTSVVVYQILLLGGYLWAHALQRWTSPRTGFLLHSGLLILATLTLPPRIGTFDGMELAGSLPLQVGWQLLVAIGPVFFLLSATGPLVQAWQSTSHPGRNPYRLYALSNAGSLIGLLAYPTLIESGMGLSDQVWFWSLGFGLFAASLIAAGGQIWNQPRWHGVEEDSPAGGIGESAGFLRIAVWVLLPAVASGLMLSITTVLCQEVTSFPFLWVLPLAVYLVAWMIAFDRPRWYRRRPAYLMLVATGMAGLLLQILGNDVSIVIHMIVLAACCFVGSLICLGELERSKPPARELTFFWAMTSVGGLLGGLLVVLGAPRWLDGFYEFHLSLAAALVVGYAVVVVGVGQARRPRLDWQSGLWSLLGLLLLGMLGTSFFQMEAIARKQGMLYVVRSDYGSMSVWEKPGYRYIQSGQTMHGRQFSDRGLRFQPLDYYAPDRAVGLAVTALRERNDRGLRIGVIGLGSGCLSAWARPGDRIRFYELNPDVVGIAWKWFDWLPEARRLKTLEEPVVVGDARMQLAAESKRGDRQKLDLLVVDAFTSDSIPVHLLTRECMDLYWQHLVPQGILAVHISNRNLDLRPALLACDEPEKKRTALLFEHAADDRNDYGCTWVLIGNRDLLAGAGLSGKATAWPAGLQPVRWTDDFNSVLPLVNWRPAIHLESLERRRKMGGRKEQPEP